MQWRCFKREFTKEFISRLISVSSKISVLPKHWILIFFNSDLVQWLWPKLLRQELNKFVEFRNGVRMRKDSQKAGPSGMSRNDAFTLFESWGGQNCLLSIPDCEPIRTLKAELGGEAILDFVTPDYAARVQAAYTNLGILCLNFENVWVVFQDLFKELHN